MELRNRILQGDALSVLRTLPDNLVDCVVTSPPYWGLRDYVGIELNPEYVKMSDDRLAMTPAQMRLC